MSMPLHPNHRHKKASKILVDLVLLQGTRGSNTTHQYAGEEFVIVYTGDIDIDHLVRELIRSLDRAEDL
jgi:hypothetical protein